MAVKRVALARRPGERNSSQANQLLPTHPVFAQSLFLSPSPSRRSVACEADRGAPGVAASGADFIFDMVEPSPLTPEERLIEAPGLSVPAFAAKGAACAIANESMTMAKVFINVSLWLDGSKWSDGAHPNHADEAMFPTNCPFLFQRVVAGGVFDRSSSSTLIGSATVWQKLAAAIGRASLDIVVLDVGADQRSA